jgi:hypothetical protein
VLFRKEERKKRKKKRGKKRGWPPYTTKGLFRRGSESILSFPDLKRRKGYMRGREKAPGEQHCA